MTISGIFTRLYSVYSICTEYTSLFTRVFFTVFVCYFFTCCACYFYFFTYYACYFYFLCKFIFLTFFVASTSFFDGLYSSCLHCPGKTKRRIFPPEGFGWACLHRFGLAERSEYRFGLADFGWWGASLHRFGLALLMTRVATPVRSGMRPCAPRLSAPVNRTWKYARKMPQTHAPAPLLRTHLFRQRIMTEIRAQIPGRKQDCHAPVWLGCALVRFP